MANYLVIENDLVINVIVADSIEIAAEVTDKEVIEAYEGGPWIGWTRANGAWIAPVETVEVTPLPPVEG